METLIGIGVALAVAAVAARTIIREAHPNGAHKSTGRATTEQRDPPALHPTRSPDAPAAEPVEQVPQPPSRAPAPSVSAAIPPTPSTIPSENGVVVTPFRPFARPALPTRVHRRASSSVDLLPGARIEVVDLDEAPPLWRPAVRPDPDRLIQTEIAIARGPMARAFALARLIVGVVSFGVLFGVGIVFGVRLIVTLFQAMF